MGIFTFAKHGLFAFSLGILLNLLPSVSLAEANQIPDLNGNGFDKEDFARGMAAFARFSSLLETRLPAPFGISIATDGKLEVGSSMKDGKLQAEDFLPAFQRYVSQAWYFGDHGWGLAATHRRVVNCINQGPSCAENSQSITALDINMDGRLNALDALAVVNVLNGMRAMQRDSSISNDFWFFRYKVTVDDLFKYFK